MPNVAGVEYPYTPEGVAAAQQAQRQIQKTNPWVDMPYMPYMPYMPFEPNLDVGLGSRMSPPLTSPSHPMAQRQVPDLQRYNAPPISTMDMYAALPSAQFMNNLYQYGRGNSPSSPWYQPVAPTPRGNVVETYGSGNYGSSPSNPNWGQDTGGRSIQKSGPLPVSTRTQAISPQDRINANIRAVMARQQGPSPGTSPTGQAPARPPRSWQNQFGPTGQPMAQRVPAQKMIDNVVKQLPGG